MAEETGWAGCVVAVCRLAPVEGREGSQGSVCLGEKPVCDCGHVCTCELLEGECAAGMSQGQGQRK